MGDKHQVKMANVLSKAAVDDEGIVLAIVKADTVSGEINILWLPEIFSRPLPLAVREQIAEKLRFHADKMGSGELEREMQRFIGVNNPQNRTEREQ